MEENVVIGAPVAVATVVAVAPRVTVPTIERPYVPLQTQVAVVRTVSIGSSSLTAIPGPFSNHVLDGIAPFSGLFLFVE